MYSTIESHWKRSEEITLEMYHTSSQESRAKTEQAIVADGKVISQFKAQFNWAWLNSAAAAPALETVYQTKLTKLRSSHHTQLTEASAICDDFIDIKKNKWCLKFWHTLSLLFLVSKLIKSILGWVAFVRNWAHNIFLSNAFLLDTSIEGSTSIFQVHYTQFGWEIKTNFCLAGTQVSSRSRQLVSGL